jgi:hypothetical protein
VQASYAAIFFRLAWYYGGKGRAARKFFWGCLWKTLRQSPRIVGQMVIYLGMYVHFCKVHQLALSWDPWGAPARPEKTPTAQASTKRSKNAGHLKEMSRAEARNGSATRAEKIVAELPSTS